jgi:glycerol uptake facilitator-like aquaporin
LALFIAALIPLVLIFVIFEAGSRAKGMAPPGPAQSIFGALVTCVGLVMMALSGIGADNALGVNWVAVVLVVLGVAVATKSFQRVSEV